MSSYAALRQMETIRPMSDDEPPQRVESKTRKYGDAIKKQL
jgi:hypothetical protein